MPVATTAELKTALAGTLQVAESALDPRWDAVILRAVDDGYRDILSIFIGKGYTKPQVDAWTGLKSYHLRQSEYWALVYGSGLHAYDDRYVEKRNQKSILKEIGIDTDTGIVQGEGDPGFVFVGRFNTTDDAITRDTPL